ncbi:unnamed protein product [Schistosoma margrebowiei]|uniref:Uncharacterized protein n=1 Tax=Schistosoma margrebowiei TaxID=48269 RepID=A0A183MBI2_9TREM|nr:unnamed protein product [Schistosoma margrebowiei]
MTEIGRQRNGWAEHFEKSLNRPTPLNPSDIEAAPIDLPMDVTPPTIEDIRMVIRQTKSGKAAESDNIPAEVTETHESTELSGGKSNITLQENSGSSCKVDGICPIKCGSSSISFHDLKSESPLPQGRVPVDGPESVDETEPL